MGGPQSQYERGGKEKKKNQPLPGIEPRSFWHIKMDLTKTECSGVEWISLAQDRDLLFKQNKVIIIFFLRR
jgi:hypothetical protein